MDMSTVCSGRSRAGEFMKPFVMCGAIGATLALWSAPLAAQPAETSKVAPKASSGTVPRLADGHPDLSGVWWRGEDIGGRNGAAIGGRGGARGRPAQPPATFASLYQPEALAKSKTLRDKDDPSLGCVPTAFGTLNVSLFDVGAVGQIVQTPKFVVMLTETYH